LGAYGLTGSRKLSVPVRVFLALLTRTITDRDFTLLLSERSAPEGGYLNNFFRTLAMNNLPLGRVSIRRCENEDDDWITFEVGSSKASVPEPLGASPADTCEIPVSVIVNDLATLDGCQPTTGTRKPLARKISKNECEFILAMLAQARLLDLAELINEGRTLRLTFGRKDAAIGPYF